MSFEDRKASIRINNTDNDILYNSIVEETVEIGKIVSFAAELEVAALQLYFLLLRQQSRAKQQLDGQQRLLSSSTVVETHPQHSDRLIAFYGTVHTVQLSHLLVSK